MSVGISQPNIRRGTENAAGGLAIYRNLQSKTIFRLIAVTADNHARCTNNIDDVSHFDANIDSRMKLALDPVRVHRNTPQRDTPVCLCQSLVPHAVTLGSVRVHPGISQRDTPLRLFQLLVPYAVILGPVLVACPSRPTTTRQSRLPL
jgi:hypothetical protein